MNNNFISGTTETPEFRTLETTTFSITTISDYDYGGEENIPTPARF